MDTVQTEQRITWDDLKVAPTLVEAKQVRVNIKYVKLEEITEEQVEEARKWLADSIKEFSLCYRQFAIYNPVVGLCTPSEFQLTGRTQNARTG